MTGYQSKKAAAQDKLAQPEQEALKLALEALKEIARHATTPWEDEWCGELANETLKAINALAQPAQEPLTCQGRKCQACETNGFKHSPECIVDTAKEQGWSNAPPAAQPAQEPPPWWPAVENILTEYGLQAIDFVADFKEAMKDAPQRPWVGLTDEEMQAVVDAQLLVSNINVYFKAIEAKLKEKNNG